MTIVNILILISSLSFYSYVVSYFTSPFMKKEFKRFNLEKLGLTVIILEILGATGLLIGLKINIILIVSSLGLSLLMFFAFTVRIYIKDSFWVSFPAIFFMFLNFYIFIKSI